MVAARETRQFRGECTVVWPTPTTAASVKSFSFSEATQTPPARPTHEVTNTFMTCVICVFTFDDDQ